ncbi:MAG: biotin/lipoyl-binding protein [Clostridia bacterium]|nr:biotin/lipoyl-binding protein [Clostridia bacterium]
MRKFAITVNGNTYEVEVEEIGGAPVYAAAPVAAPVAAAPAAAPVAAPAAPKAAPAAAPKAAAPAGAAGANKVNAPMPGTILDVKVSVGQSVKNGDVLCILEAMKMENEIAAPCDGVVASINVTKGATVNTGDLLLSLN